jgi:hypothetical protein
MKVFYFNRYLKNTTKTDGEWAVLVVKNQKLVKVLNYYDKEYYAKKLFEKVKIENTYEFPKKVVTHDTSFVRSDWEVLIVRKRRHGDEFRTVSTCIGEITEVAAGDWTIIDKFELYDEETFKVYGYSTRMTVTGILANILHPLLSSKDIYDVYILHNKLFFTCGNKSILILCKTCNDASRLHNYLLDFYNSISVTKFFFRGNPASTIRRKELLEQASKAHNVSMSWMMRRSVMP